MVGVTLIEFDCVSVHRNHSKIDLLGLAGFKNICNDSKGQGCNNLQLMFFKCLDGESPPEHPGYLTLINSKWMPKTVQKGVSLGHTKPPPFGHTKPKSFE